MAKRKNKKVPTTKLCVMDGPTPETQQHHKYERGEIIHAETFTRAKVYRVQRQSSIRLLYEKGQMTGAQYQAAMEIAHVAEVLQRDLAVKCASLEARVDCAGSGRNEAVEKLGYIKLEERYSRWRSSIPMPRRMIIDMVLEDRTLFATARAYGVGWPKAKRMLRDALELWAKNM